MVRQLLVEGAVVAVIAVAAGATLSVWGIGVFRSLVEGSSGAAADRLAFTNSTLLATIAIAIATPVAVSILPAIIRDPLLPAIDRAARGVVSVRGNKTVIPCR